MKRLPKDRLPEVLDMVGDIDEKMQKKDAREIFRNAVYAIHGEWQKRKYAEEQGKRAKTANNSANEFLRRNVYWIGIHLIESKQVEAVRKCVPDEPDRRKGVPSLKENIFHWILVFMFEEEPEDIYLSVRNRFAKQLLYAYRHQIPPYLLVGFLYQVAESNNLSSKLEDDRVREDWYVRLHEGYHPFNGALED